MCKNVIMFLSSVRVVRSMDVLNKEQRHKAMSHIKSKDTSIELALRRELWSQGYRYRKNECEEAFG